MKRNDRWLLPLSLLQLFDWTSWIANSNWFSEFKCEFDAFSSNVPGLAMATKKQRTSILIGHGYIFIEYNTYHPILQIFGSRGPNRKKTHTAIDWGQAKETETETETETEKGKLTQSNPLCNSRLSSTAKAELFRLESHPRQQTVLTNQTIQKSEPQQLIINTKSTCISS